MRSKDIIRSCKPYGTSHFCCEQAYNCRISGFFCFMYYDTLEFIFIFLVRLGYLGNFTRLDVVSQILYVQIVYLNFFSWAWAHYYGMQNVLVIDVVYAENRYIPSLTTCPLYRLGLKYSVTTYDVSSGLECSLNAYYSCHLQKS